MIPHAQNARETQRAVIGLINGPIVMIFSVVMLSILLAHHETIIDFLTTIAFGLWFGVFRMGTAKDASTKT